VTDLMGPCDAGVLKANSKCSFRLGARDSVAQVDVTDLTAGAGHFRDDAKRSRNSVLTLGL
jgi:hypothetical protein